VPKLQKHSRIDFSGCFAGNYVKITKKTITLELHAERCRIDHLLQINCSISDLEPDLLKTCARVNDSLPLSPLPQSSTGNVQS
jgi:hypothetical protein